MDQVPQTGSYIEQLRQENDDLQRALATVERHLQTALAEKEQISSLYSDFKTHYDQMRG
jgi:type II secretory pathway component PulJ